MEYEECTGAVERPVNAETVAVREVNKSFRGRKVVDNVSFDVVRGEILGMLGPNGAGKTTTLRMMMDIMRPDSGRILILGEPLTEAAKSRIGYLPEERGLYKKLTVMQCLLYLAVLKGMKPAPARESAEELLRRVNMLQHRDKKTGELSKGMSQIVQFVSTIVHDPELVVLDEPFSGLDPVNTAVIKELIVELRTKGKSVIMSTHMMNQIEEVCDRALMIDNGCVVLCGSLAEIKSRYRNNSLFLVCDRLPEGVPGVVGTRDGGKHLELFLDGKTSPQEVLNFLVGNGTRVDRFEVSTPSLNEIFLQLVKAGR
jgi:ABC-2 type transport system ATP-binding protein